MAEPWLEELSEQECIGFLQANAVGRIGVVRDGKPFVFPINYRFIDFSERRLLVIRTRPGNVIDTAEIDVAFEVDGIDPSHQRGWSVLAQGVLRHVAGDPTLLAAHFDSDTWIPDGRTEWLVFEPSVITGRRLLQPTPEWAFHQSAYL